MALYDKLEDGSFAGEIPKLKGVAAFGNSLREWEANYAPRPKIGSSPACGWNTNCQCWLALI